jgi:hypothetical protein
MRSVVFGLALATAMAVFAGQPSSAQQAQTKEMAPTIASAPVNAYPSSGSRLFDMKQCRGEDDCQLATCRSMLTPGGAITICQSHGTFFP